MPALIDLRRRIKSVKNTQQITQAMKTVATAKFKKAQKSVMEGRPYWHNYPELIKEMSGWVSRQSHPLLEKREEKNILCIVIVSDKGLCGAFNSNLLEEARQQLEEKAKHSSVRLVLIGKKAVQFFKRSEFPVEHAYQDYMHEFHDEDLEKLTQHLMRLYTLHHTDAVYVAYNEFKSIIAPKITFSRLLPLEPPWNSEEEEAEKKMPIVEKGMPDMEPGSSPLLDALLPVYVEDQIFHYFYESVAAEHAARMMAMDNATRNAEDLISDLTLELNKIRQASITTELLEIQSAVEALD